MDPADIPTYLEYTAHVQAQYQLGVAIRVIAAILTANFESYLGLFPRENLLTACKIFVREELMDMRDSGQKELIVNGAAERI